LDKVENKDWFKADAWGLGLILCEAGGISKIDLSEIAKSKNEGKEKFEEVLKSKL